LPDWQAGQLPQANMNGATSRSPSLCRASRPAATTVPPGLSEMFTERERLEVFACPNCGCVEFFVEGHGQQNRAQNAVAAQPVVRTATTVEKAEGKLQEGNLHESRGQLEAAVAHYEEVITKYPGTALAKDAETRLRAIKDKLGI
jgi:hypothetical protein